MQLLCSQKPISFSIQTRALHFLVSWNEQRLASLLSLLGLVLGRIGDDDKSSLQLPIRREDFPQLIERGLLSQESSIAHLGTGIPQTAVKTFPRRLDPLLKVATYLRLFADFVLQSRLRRKPCSLLWAYVNHPVMAPAALMLVGKQRVERGGSKVVILPSRSLTKPCAPQPR